MRIRRSGKVAGAHWGRGAGWNLKRVIRKGLTDKVTFEQRLTGSEGVTHADTGVCSRQPVLEQPAQRPWGIHSLAKKPVWLQHVRDKQPEGKQWGSQVVGSVGIVRTLTFTLSDMGSHCQVCDRQMIEGDLDFERIALLIYWTLRMVLGIVLNTIRTLFLQISQQLLGEDSVIII